MKYKVKYLPILLFSCIAFGVILGGLINFPNQNISFNSNSSKSKLNSLIDFINESYVDKVNTDSIVNITVNTILSNLDPHSIYIPPNEQKIAAENMKGDFVGIGVNFYMYKDTVAVIHTIENGPSEKAGLKPGDRILYADKTKLFGRKLPTDSLYAKLKGKAGSEVNLTVYRKSENKKLNFKIIRDVVPIKSVDASLLINKNTGYIKINRFSENTYNEFYSGLTKLKNQGANSIIIDLRDNGGGYLERAVEIADEFLKENELIVFTKDKKGNINKTYATEKGIFEEGEVTVLIDENSASASEILAGAIQDNDRGTIIGRRSYGKGLVQREMNFEDGSAVRLTVARYYTPSGRSIQKSYKNGNKEYHNDFEARFISGELYEKDKIQIADSLKYKTKKGRIVYGGGGIVPDIFVPLELEHGTEGLNYILKSGIVGHFVFETIDKDRKKYNNMTFDEFNSEFNNNKQVRLFEIFLEKVGLFLSLKNNESIVKRYINAEFARQLFNENRYYSILLQEDKMIKAALKK